MSCFALIGLLALLALLSAEVVRWMIRVGALDHPGHRSSHTSPTPKGGGVGIVAAFMVGLVTLYGVSKEGAAESLPLFGLLLASGWIAAISYADDLRSWSFAVKLGAQLAAALGAIACGIRFHVLHLPWIGDVHTGLAGVPLTVAWFLFAINAVNFIDGLNGLASGTMLIACVFVAFSARSHQDWLCYSASMVLAAGIAGFLPYNYPRARIFMGDVGSQFCGFVIAALGVREAAYPSDGFPALLVPGTLLGILSDVAFTLARRWLAGDIVTEAHRSHLYQVAHRSGQPAAQITLIYWTMAAWGGLCTLALPMVTSGWRTALLVLECVPPPLWLCFVLHRAGKARLTRW